MGRNIKLDAVFIKHSTHEGVFIKHFFTKDETNGSLNNLEINIVPGFQNTPHIHENADEYFYVVEGEGEYLDNTEWIPIKKGDAFRALMGMAHSVKNTGRVTLVLFSTFTYH
jgi:mannose-6-phosphate isomerase-like protein (cupin superfamily)